MDRVPTRASIVFLCAVAAGGVAHCSGTSGLSGGGAEADVAAPSPMVSAPTPPESDGTCLAGRKLCTGACATLEDPGYGCGAPACAPCAIPGATATCHAGACAIGSCATGQGDCDGTAGNGC